MTTQSLDQGFGWPAYPYGADNLLTPLLAADDEVFLVFPFAGPSQTRIGPLFTYDSALPLNSSITSVAYALQHSQNYVANGVLQLDSGIAFATENLPVPSQPVEGMIPRPANWVNTTITFDATNSFPGVFPLSVDDFVSKLEQYAPQSIVNQWTSGKVDNAGFVNYFTTTLNFTLPLPSSISSSTPFDVFPTRLSAFSGIRTVAGDANELYPLYYQMQYTLLDPSNRDFDELSTGIGAIQSTEPQQLRLLSTDDAVSLDKFVRVTATTPNNLTPGSTYFLRFIVYNADREQVTGPWVSTTTPKFDQVLSY